MTAETTDSGIEAALLCRIPLFAELTPEDAGALAAAGHIATVPAGTLLCKEGDAGDQMHVVVKGQVRVHQERDGTNHELAQLGAGAHFGEMALIDGRERSASVTAVSQCELFTLSRKDFFEVVSDNPLLLGNILLYFSKTIRNNNRRMLDQVLEQERRKSAAELQRHQSISQMVAGLAHEINTPLGIINQAASIIATSVNEKTYDQLALDEAARRELADMHDAAQLILSNSERARTLVTSFKNLSVRQITDTRETVDLGELVREVVGLYRLQAKKENLELSINNQLVEGEGDWDGYPGYFSQILLNLFQNVARHAYPDGGGGPVNIVVAPQADGFLVSVSDLGAGIAEGHLADVCTPFFTTGRSTGGTGLGMAIVHNLVTTALEGTIDIQSTQGKGTTVSLTFPRVLAGPSLSSSSGPEHSP